MRHSLWRQRDPLSTTVATVSCIGSIAMTDYEEFVAFFTCMGVGLEEWRNEYGVYRGDHGISVAQTHFCFDADGRYIGALADEMGYFEKRKNEH